jgi:hypothetical protein
MYVLPYSYRAQGKRFFPFLYLPEASYSYSPKLTPLTLTLTSHFPVIPPLSPACLSPSLPTGWPRRLVAGLALRRTWLLDLLHASLGLACLHTLCRAAGMAPFIRPRRETGGAGEAETLGEIWDAGYAAARIVPWGIGRGLGKVVRRREGARVLVSEARGRGA